MVCVQIASGGVADCVGGAVLVPDLLRLFGIFRHRDWLRAAVRVRPQTEFQPAVPLALNPRILAQEAASRFDDLEMDNSEVWVVFDNDGRDTEVKEAIDLINNSGKDIHIAFMKPCIEIWPLMHNGINNVTTQAMAQSKLKNIMPSYKHDRNPYFDLNKMPDYEGAVAKAKQWQTSLSGAPEYDSAKFAGIYKLTEKIKDV